MEKEVIYQPETESSSELPNGQYYSLEEAVSAAESHMSNRNEVDGELNDSEVLNVYKIPAEGDKSERYLVSHSDWVGDGKQYGELEEVWNPTSR